MKKLIDWTRVVLAASALAALLVAPVLVVFAAAPGTWTTPDTSWTTGEVVTSATFNAMNGNTAALGNGMTGTVSACTTVDTTVNNSTALTNVTGAVVVINASERYAFLAIIHATSGTVPDFDFAMNGPTTPTVLRYGVTGQAPIGAAGDATVYNTRVSIGGMGFDALYMVAGYVSNGSTAGNLLLRFSQNVANVSNSTVYAGSCLLVWRIA